jgi:hypothetical protein
MDFVTGFEAEVWFRLTCQRLRMLDTNPPSIRRIESVLRKYLPKKTERALNHMIDEDDPDLWLDLILKVDSLLCLEDLNNNQLKIGVDVTTFAGEASAKFLEISSRLFQEARRELGIQKHWILLVSSLSLPSDDMLIDKFYEFVDRSEECSIIDLSL